MEDVVTREKKEKKNKIKLIKIAARRFRVIGQDADGSDIVKLLAPAEYAVEKEGERVALIVKTGDGWRVCRPSDSSRLGLAVSPVGLDGFREVAAWAVRSFA